MYIYIYYVYVYGIGAADSATPATRVRVVVRRRLSSTRVRSTRVRERGFPGHHSQQGWSSLEMGAEHQVSQDGPGPGTSGAVPATALISFNIHVLCGCCLP